MTPTGLLSQLLIQITSGRADAITTRVRKLETVYQYYSDDDLRSAINRFIAGEADQVAEKPPTLLQRLLDFFRPTRTQDRTILGVALASAAFRKAPADLPGESVHLFDGQIAAACYMTDGRHVHMDTGEGKTYALVAAAFAALGSSERVYIITPNEILAERDARRTKPFWDWVGIELGLCTAGFGTAASDDPSWSARVVYTTSSGLSSKFVNDLLAPEPRDAPVQFDTILLDETDAILFDQPGDGSRIVTGLATDPRSWAEAFSFANSLDEADVVDDFVVSGDVALSAEGWSKVADYEVQTPGLGPWRFAVMVESAYTCLRCVRPDIDYRVEGRKVRMIDRHTGIASTSRPGWLIALSTAAHLDTLPGLEEIYSVSFLRLLRLFKVVGGASGTASSVALDILLLLGQRGLPAAVKPRTPRQRFSTEDLVYKERQAAFEAAAIDAVDLAATRPVLVGAQNARDALEFHSILTEHSGSGSASGQIRIDRVLEDEWSSDSFDLSGDVGRITVTTYFAARGTDIRLTDEAKAAGGLHLVLLGRSREGRLDRQFIGRAGRQGDPWSAVFFNSLDMDMMKVFATGAMKRVMDSTLPPDVPIDSKMVSRSIVRAQRTAERLRQQRAADQTMMSENTELFHSIYERVLRAIQRFDPGTDGQETADWLATNLMEAQPVAAEPEVVAAFLQDAIGDATDLEAILASVATSETPRETAREELKRAMVAAISARQNDIDGHEAYHSSLRSYSRMLGEARHRCGITLDPELQSDLPTDRVSMERLAAQLRTLLERDRKQRVEPRAALEAGNGSVAADGASETTGLELVSPGSPRLVPAASPELVEMAATKWTLTTPCLRPGGCSRNERSALGALRWEAHRIWRDTQRKRDAKFFEIAVSDASIGAKQQKRAAALEALTEEMQRDLFSNLVWTTLSLDRWEEMDETFYIMDNEVSWDDPVVRRGEWRATPTRSRDTAAVVGQVILSVAQEHPVAVRDHITRVLTLFTQTSPVAALQSGRACAEAMRRFQEEDLTRGVSFSERRRNLHAIADFLAAAQAAQLIPETPTRLDHISSQAKRATLAFKSARHLDALLALPVLVLLVAVSSLITIDLPLAEPSGLPLLVVWAGFVAAVHVVAIPLAGFDHQQRSHRIGLIMPQLMVLFFVLGLSRALADDVEFSGGLVVGSLLAAVAAHMLSNIMNTLRIRIGVDGLAGAAALFMLGLLVAAWAEGWRWVAVPVVVGVLEAIRSMIDRHRLRVVGGAVSSFHTAATPVKTFVKVRLGPAAHRYVVALAAVVVYLRWPGNTIDLDAPAPLEVGFIYGGTVAIMLGTDIGRRMTLESVEGMLAERRLFPDGASDDLASEVRSVRRRVIGRELTMLALTLGAVWFLADGTVSQPMQLAALTSLGVLGTTLIKDFIGSVWSSVAGFSSQTLTLDHRPPDLDVHDRSIVERAVDRLRGMQGVWPLLIGAYVLIVHLLDLLGVIEAVRWLWGWVTGSL